MLARGGRFVAAWLSAFAVGCGGSSTDRTAVSDRFRDAKANDGGDQDAGSRNIGAGGYRGSIDAGSVAPDADAATLVDASNDGAPGLCAPPPSGAPDIDAGKCLGIYYATVARLVLWVDDASGQSDGARISLSRGETKTVGGHTYGYSGNSLITSGSAVEIHLDVDGQRDSLTLDLEGCAPRIATSVWDYPAALSRTLCTGCAPTTIARHYVVAESQVDGGLEYTFTADEPPRACGAGIDLLRFTTWPG